MLCNHFLHAHALQSSDSDNFDTQTWEGTVGVAERLWSGSRAKDAFNVTAALPRLAVHVCRMRGPRAFIVFV